MDAKRLVDFFVLSAFLTSDYAMPVEEFRGQMGNRPVPIYTTIEWRYGPNLHCPESLRAAALNLLTVARMESISSTFRAGAIPWPPYPTIGLRTWITAIRGEKAITVFRVV